MLSSNLNVDVDISKQLIFMKLEEVRDRGLHWRRKIEPRPEAIRRINLIAS